MAWGVITCVNVAAPGRHSRLCSCTSKVPIPGPRFTAEMLPVTLIVCPPAHREDRLLGELKTQGAQF